MTVKSSFLPGSTNLTWGEISLWNLAWGDLLWLRLLLKSAICCKCSAMTLERKPCWQSLSLNSKVSLTFSPSSFCNNVHIARFQCEISRQAMLVLPFDLDYTDFYLLSFQWNVSSHSFTKGRKVSLLPKNMSYKCTTGELELVCHKRESQSLTILKILPPMSKFLWGKLGWLLRYSLCNIIAAIIVHFITTLCQLLTGKLTC